MALLAPDCPSVSFRNAGLSRESAVYHGCCVVSAAGDHACVPQKHSVAESKRPDFVGHRLSAVFCAGLFAAVSERPVLPVGCAE